MLDGDRRLHPVGELAFGPFSGQHQRLGGGGVGQRVSGARMRVQELPGQVPGERFVPVGPAESVVAVDGDHRDPAVGELDHGHVERGAAEVVDERHFLLGRATGEGRVGVETGETVRERCRGRFVDDVDDRQARVLPGEDGGPAFLVAEVRRHGEDRVTDGLPTGEGRVADERPQNKAAHRRRGPRPSRGHEAPVTIAHPAFDQRADIIRAGASELTGGFTGDIVIRTDEEHDARHRGHTAGQRNRLGIARSVHPGNAAVGGPKINSVDDARAHPRNVSRSHGRLDTFQSDCVAHRNAAPTGVAGIAVGDREPVPGPPIPWVRLDVRAPTVECLVSRGPVDPAGRTSWQRGQRVARLIILGQVASQPFGRPPERQLPQDDDHPDHRQRQHPDAEPAGRPTGLGEQLDASPADQSEIEDDRGDNDADDDTDLHSSSRASRPTVRPGRPGVRRTPSSTPGMNEVRSKES